MRYAPPLGVLIVLLYMCLYANSPDSHAYSFAAKISTSSDSKAAINFEEQIKPIFQARCQPCHFNGGVMYDRLPFDRAETIKKLGEKLFTRIKDEKEQRLLREFLAQ